MFEEIFSLRGRKALVTGSSRGIGRAAALLLGEAGAEVWFHASRPSPALETTLNEARQRGIAAHGITADLADLDAVEQLTRSLKETDILVLNASVQSYQTPEEFTAEEFAREFDTNVRSAFALVKAYLPGMRRRGFGRIVSIGSVNQWKPTPRLSVYAATKAAQANLILTCARSSAQYGVTANNVAPGVITTDRNRTTLSDPERARQIMAGIPAGRFGVPEDCAGVVLLLCSDAGSYITGADIPVSGGMQL